MTTLLDSKTHHVFEAKTGEWFLDQVSEELWKELTASQGKQIRLMARHFADPYYYPNTPFEIEIGISRYHVWIRIEMKDPSFEDILSERFINAASITKRGKLLSSSKGRFLF